jgi:hypothetical protein
LAHPHTTYHLDPFLTALAWLFAARMRRTTSLGLGAAPRAATGAATLALAVTAALAFGHALRGPTITSRGSATAEAFIATAAGRNHTPRLGI